MNSSARNEQVKPVRSRSRKPRGQRKRQRRTRRIVVYVTIGLTLLAVAAPIGLWARYRFGHVISQNALVKGHIAEVGSQLSGVVASVLVDEGDRVESGQVLASFGDHQLRATVERARSNLQKATRGLEAEILAIEHERLKLASLIAEATATLAAATAQVQAALSRADDAKQTLELRRSLAKQELIPLEEVRVAEAEHRTALALVSAARANEAAARAAEQSARVNASGLAVREKRATVLEAEVAALRAELAMTQADLDGCVIRAPADGWVVRRIVEPGASVVTGQPLLSIWTGDDVWVEAWIDENQLGQVNVGNEARVTLKSYPDRVFTGVVERMAVSTDYELPEADVPNPRHSRMRGTPIVSVRIGLNEVEGLFPGMSGTVGIRKKKRDPHVPVVEPEGASSSEESLTDGPGG